MKGFTDGRKVSSERVKALIVNNGSCCISPRISDQSSANDNTQRLAATETTEQHGNLNLFHFQNDQMWPVNMNGKTKG